MPQFAEVPGHRFMYDQDGTVCYISPQSAQTPLTQISGDLYNDEDLSDNAGNNGGSSSAWREITFAFPEPREITGVAAMRTAGGSCSAALWYSVDTTDGTDGTWISWGSLTEVSSYVHPFSRSVITPVTGVSEAKGLRLRWSNNAPNSSTIAAVHIYGTIPVTANPERVEFWHPTDDAIMPKGHLDLGDLRVGSSITKQFRIKNLSTTKTAGAVVISRDNAAGGSTNESMVTGTQFSLDNVSWSNTVSIDSIAPGAISPVVYVRRVVAGSETPTLRFLRVKATPSTFAA